MRKIVSSLVLILISTLLYGDQKPVVEFDNQADFSKYMRYSWKTGTPAARAKVHQAIIAAIDRELQSKGRIPVSKDPNFYVLYHGSTEKELSVESFGYTYGEMGGGKLQVIPVQAGTLIIDLIDAGRGKTVWRGTATGALPASAEAEKMIRSKIAEIFMKFPPRRLQ